MGNCLCNDNSSYNEDDLVHLQFVSRLHDHHEIPTIYYEANQTWPTLIYFHPHNMDLGEIDCKNLSQEFECNILTFDYCGLGLHSQRFLSQHGLEEDCIAMFYFARTKLKISQNQLRLMGDRFGTGLACFLTHYLCQRRVFLPLVLLDPMPTESVMDFWWESIEFPIAKWAKDILSDTVCVHYRDYKHLEQDDVFELLCKQFPYLQEAFIEPYECDSYTNTSRASILRFLQTLRE